MGQSLGWALNSVIGREALFLEHKWSDQSQCPRKRGSKMELELLEPVVETKQEEVVELSLEELARVGGGVAINML